MLLGVFHHFPFVIIINLYNSKLESEVTVFVSLISVYFQLFPEGDDQVGWHRSVGYGNVLWLTTGNFSMPFCLHAC